MKSFPDSVGNSGFVNGIQVLVSDRLYPELTGTDAYAELRPVLHDNADRTAFDLVLEQFCQKPESHRYEQGEPV